MSQKTPSWFNIIWSSSKSISHINYVPKGSGKRLLDNAATLEKNTKEEMKKAVNDFMKMIRTGKMDAKLEQLQKEVRENFGKK